MWESTETGRKVLILYLRADLRNIVIVIVIKLCFKNKYFVIQETNYSFTLLNKKHLSAELSKFVQMSVCHLAPKHWGY